MAPPGEDHPQLPPDTVLEESTGDSSLAKVAEVIETEFPKNESHQPDSREVSESLDIKYHIDIERKAQKLSPKEDAT